MSESFPWEEISGRIETESIGQKIYFYENTDSTNIRARLLAEGCEEHGGSLEAKTEGVGGLGRTAEDVCKEGKCAGAPHGTVVVAEAQSAGRGRRGRAWESPAGKNLYFTLILKPDFAPDKAAMLTLVMAMAVKRGLVHTLQAKQRAGAQGNKESSSRGKAHGDIFGIKWPNDLVVNGRKICGILTELSVVQGQIAHVLIGVGINVKKQQFAPELADNATDVETECGQAVSRQELLEAVLKAFEEEYKLFLETCDLSRIKERYNACLVNVDREVRVLDPKEEYTGVARGINSAGELLLELPDGRISEVYAGEVSVRGIYGYV